MRAHTNTNRRCCRRRRIPRKYIDHAAPRLDMREPILSHHLAIEQNIEVIYFCSPNLGFVSMPERIFYSSNAVDCCARARGNFSDIQEIVCVYRCEILYAARRGGGGGGLGGAVLNEIRDGLLPWLVRFYAFWYCLEIEDGGWKTMWESVLVEAMWWRCWCNGLW